ncbi:MAG: long-chain fatty acid--CoA ligase, partial [Comamonas sp.]|nr:long-chain fatty acid--CoA ligase [Comamonas sp.]
LAWNTHRHLELYYAVSGAGAVLHTVNPRLFADQIRYIINHAADDYVFFDLSFAGLVAELAPSLKTVKAFVALCKPDQMPAMDLPAPLLCYEDLVAEDAGDFDWPELAEDSASSLCYTSGTTGNPKGVLYSHRSTVLHSWVVCAADGLALRARDCVLLTVPMFHVNAWGLPYASAMCGAKLVLPGPDLSGKALYQLMRDEGCTFSLGVPTVWMGFLQYVESLPAGDKDALKPERIMMGGSAAPRAMIDQFDSLLGVTANQAWGMTETSPVATVSTLLPRHEALARDERIDVRARQGRPMYGVDVAIFDDEGQQLPPGDPAPGELRVRGPWVISAYYGQDAGSALDAQGWFSTGDVARIDNEGFVQITDRAKDVIKSGGEWISSIDIENLALAHPAVKEAAVIGVHHERWQERPLLVIVRKPGTDVSGQDVLDFMKDRLARWWLPDAVEFVDELPHTATGKLLKTRLREQFKGYQLPAATAAH